MCTVTVILMALGKNRTSREGTPSIRLMFNSFRMRRMQRYEAFTRTKLSRRSQESGIARY